MDELNALDEDELSWLKSQQRQMVGVADEVYNLCFYLTILQLSLFREIIERDSVEKEDGWKPKSADDEESR